MKIGDRVRVVKEISKWTNWLGTTGTVIEMNVDGGMWAETIPVVVMPDDNGNFPAGVWFELDEVEVIEPTREPE